MKKKYFVSLAAAAVAALFCLMPVKADAAELINSDEYGEVLVVDVPGGEGLLFLGNTSGEVMQFKGKRRRSLFCQIQCDGCHSGEGKGHSQLHPCI